MKRKIKKLAEEKKQLREQLKIAYADIYKKNLEYEGNLVHLYSVTK
ncbi:hypothetical protein ABER90_07105 [Bacillus paranthracis]|nr:hypothetical protein [Bacillus cereus]MDZ4481680.1 hypothetical protein [Bacillus cereus]